MKKRSKIALLTSTILVVALLAIAFILTTFKLNSRNNSSHEDHNSKRIFSSAYYTLESVNEKTGCEFSRSDRSTIHFTCDDRNNEYHGVEFIILSSEDEAISYYDDYIEENLYNIQDFNCYTTGMLSGICDASINVCVMRFSNLVVKYDLEVWGDEYIIDDNYEGTSYNLIHDQGFIDAFIEEWSVE